MRFNDWCEDVACWARRWFCSPSYWLSGVRFPEIAFGIFFIHYILYRFFLHPFFANCTYLVIRRIINYYVHTYFCITYVYYLLYIFSNDKPFYPILYKYNFFLSFTFFLFLSLTKIAFLPSIRPLYYCCQGDVYFS